MGDSGWCLGWVVGCRRRIECGYRLSVGSGVGLGFVGWCVCG